MTEETKPAEQTAIAIPDSSAWDSPAALAIFGQDQACLHSLNLKTEEGFLLFQRACNATAATANEKVGEEQLVEHVVMMQADMVDKETGEVIPRVRTVLITPDGNMFASSSPYVRRSIGAMIKGLYGPPPWKPALRIKIAGSKTSASYIVHTLDVLGRANGETKKRK